MESLLILDNAPYIWLAVGALFLALEAFGATGIGFLFAGLGAITAALLAHFGIALSWGTQLAYCFSATILWAFILWKPMKRLRAQQHSGLEPYENMVGDEVTVLSGGLTPGKNGKVKWSGTTMNARLADGSDALEEGASARIKKVDGTLLIVASS